MSPCYLKLQVLVRLHEEAMATYNESKQKDSVRETVWLYVAAVLLNTTFLCAFCRRKMRRRCVRTARL